MPAHKAREFTGHGCLHRPAGPVRRSVPADNIELVDKKPDLEGPVRALSRVHPALPGCRRYRPGQRPLRDRRVPQPGDRSYRVQENKKVKRQKPGKNFIRRPPFGCGQTAGLPLRFDRSDRFFYSPANWRRGVTLDRSRGRGCPRPMIVTGRSGRSPGTIGPTTPSRLNVQWNRWPCVVEQTRSPRPICANRIGPTGFLRPGKQGEGGDRFFWRSGRLIVLFWNNPLRTGTERQHPGSVYILLQTIFSEPGFLQSQD